MRRQSGDAANKNVRATVPCACGHIIANYRFLEGMLHAPVGHRYHYSVEPIVAVTKVDQVRSAILRQVFSGELRPGARLVEAKLGQQLAVSQATVNAALQDLHAQGIVTKVLNKYTTVSLYTHHQIENLFTVRRVLEPAAAAAASRIMDSAGLDRLHSHVDSMRRAARGRDLSKFCLADYSFHQELYRMTDNPFLIQACQAIAAAPFAYILCDRQRTLPADYLTLAEDHHEVILAMEKGPEAAAQFLSTSIDSWLEHSLNALKRSEAGGTVPTRASAAS